VLRPSPVRPASRTSGLASPAASRQTYLQGEREGECKAGEAAQAAQGDESELLCVVRGQGGRVAVCDVTQAGLKLVQMHAEQHQAQRTKGATVHDSVCKPSLCLQLRITSSSSSSSCYPIKP
jgi:hypothetical protein